jgi:xylulokinase
MATFAAGRDLTFSDWDALARAAPPGADGLVFHPYLQGERCPYWDPQLRGSFVGATLSHRLEHVARAVYEGTAFSIRDAMSEMGPPERPDLPLTVVGGGAASDVWLQVLADVLNSPVQVAARADSSYGAALLGWVGLGARDLREAIDADGETGSKCRTPDPERVALYGRLFERYRRVHDALAPIYHDFGRS